MERMLFDISLSTHELLRRGECEPRVERVAVEACCFTHGRLAACQKATAMVHIREGVVYMATAALAVI